MTPLGDLLNRVNYGLDRTEVHVECRRCGRTLSRDATDCPCCGSTDIAAISL
ncbi:MULTISPECIES: hypothetical protein [Natrialbaceae]|uniref:hypothetical protein n=1 Tax=Natrialbaceae TaxID=1644061 RepID=UPI00207CA19F|nr:hypothetical protein [Natronococcus sp. CG52]